MKRRIYKKSNKSEKKNKKENKINKSNSFDKIYSYNINERKNINDYDIIDIIDLTSSNSVENENNIKNKNILNSKKTKNKKKSKIKETIINLDEDKSDNSIKFDFKKKNKTNKKKVKKNVSKKKPKKNVSKPKDEIISVYSLSDSEMDSSSHSLSKNNKQVNDSLYNFESNFINFSIDKDFYSNVDNKNENENFINLENNKNSIINNELTKFLNRKRGKEKNEKEEEERVNHRSKKEKEKEKLMPNFSIIKLSNKRNYPKSYSNEKYINKNELSKKEKYNNKKDILIPEIEMLYHFIKQHEIEKAINSIYNTKNFPNNKFDVCLKEIREIYGDNKLIIILIKSLISLLKENINNDKNNRVSENSKKSQNNEIFSVKNNINNKIILDKEGSDENPIQIFDDIDNNNINEKDINNYFEMRNDKVVSIESHYNKYKDGNIYKYEVGYLSGKSVIFHCFDRRCFSYGILDLETKKFRVQKDHNLSYEAHNYIVNYKKNNDVIFKEMIEKKYLDSQVYKEGKNTIVRFYY